MPSALRGRRLRAASHQDQAESASGLGRDLQAAALEQVRPQTDLDNDESRPRAAQGLLACPQSLATVGNLHRHEPGDVEVWGQSSRPESAGVPRLPHPEHESFCGGRGGQGESHSGIALRFVDAAIRETDVSRKVSPSLPYALIGYSDSGNCGSYAQPG